MNSKATAGQTWKDIQNKLTINIKIVKQQADAAGELRTILIGSKSNGYRTADWWMWADAFDTSSNFKLIK